MNDLNFHHGESDLHKAFGISEREVRKFMIDVEMDSGDTITEIVQFIWDSEASIEMKLFAIYELGRSRGRKEESFMSNPGKVIMGMIERQMEREDDDESDSN